MLRQDRATVTLDETTDPYRPGARRASSLARLSAGVGDLCGYMDTLYGAWAASDVSMCAWVCPCVHLCLSVCVPVRLSLLI